VPQADKTPREKLLQALEEKGRADLAAVFERLKQHEKIKAELDDDIARFRQDRQFHDPTDPATFRALSSLGSRQRALEQDLQDINRANELAKLRWDQEKRKIMHTYALPGDPTYIEYKSRYWTERELLEWKQYEEDHSSPMRAAQTFMKEVKRKVINNGQSGDIKVSKIVLITKNPNSKNKNQATIDFRTWSTFRGQQYVQVLRIVFRKSEDGCWEASDTQLLSR